MLNSALYWWSWYKFLVLLQLYQQYCVDSSALCLYNLTLCWSMQLLTADDSWLSSERNWMCGLTFSLSLLNFFFLSGVIWHVALLWTAHLTNIINKRCTCCGMLMVYFELICFEICIYGDVALSGRCPPVSLSRKWPCSWQ